MMAAEEYLEVFQGVKRSGNTVPRERLGRFTDRQTRQGESIPLRSCPSQQHRKTAKYSQPKGVAEIPSQRPQAFGFSLTARMRMRGETVLPAANSFRNGLNAI